MTDVSGGKVLEHATQLFAWRKPDYETFHFAMNEKTLDALKAFIDGRADTDQSCGGGHDSPDESFKLLGLEVRLDDGVPHGMVELRQLPQEDNDA